MRLLEATLNVESRRQIMASGSSPSAGPRLSTKKPYLRYALEIVSAAFSYGVLFWLASFAGRTDVFLRDTNTVLSTIFIAYSLLGIDYTLTDLRRVAERIESVAMDAHGNAFKKWKDSYEISFEAWKPWNVKRFPNNGLFGWYFMLVGAAVIIVLYCLSGAATAFLARYNVEMLIVACFLQGAPIGALIGLACWILIFEWRYVYNFHREDEKLYYGRKTAERFEICLNPFHWDGSWGLRQLIRMSVLGSIAMTFGLAMIYAQLLRSSLAVKYPIEVRIGFLVPAVLAIVSLYFLQSNLRFAIKTEKESFLKPASVELGKIVRDYVQNKDSCFAERIECLVEIDREVRKSYDMWKITRFPVASIVDLAIALAPILVEQAIKLSGASI